MPNVPVSKLKCCLKTCNAKATHLCEDCMCVGYCCASCHKKDKESHASMCKRVRRVARKTKSKSKSKSRKTASKSRSKKRKTKSKSKRKR
jgi:hypothetical protein